MNDLSSAMQRVDADRTEAVGGAGVAFVQAQRPKIAVVTEAAPEPTAPAPDPIDALAAESASRGLRAATLRGYASTLVSLAKEAGGHDPRHITAFDQLTAENIGALLIAVMDAAKIELPAAFRMSSSPADLDRAAAVAKSLEGGQAQ